MWTEQFLSATRSRHEGPISQHPGAGVRRRWFALFMLAMLTVIAWAVTGPFFGYSDTWQLFINTGTTIVTFLMMFLIQNTQNLESRVVALKLDELLRGVEGASTEFVNLDQMSDEELRAVQQEFSRLREKYAPLIEDELANVEQELKQRRQRDGT